MQRAPLTRGAAATALLFVATYVLHRQAAVSPTPELSLAVPRGGDGDTTSGAQRVRPSTFTLSGTAHTLMEDNFDAGRHFSWTVVTTDSGDTFVAANIPHGEVYHGEAVHWAVNAVDLDDPREADRHRHTGGLLDPVRMPRPSG